MYCGRVVERGDVKTIFANPSHPYTKGLLGSIPRLGDAGKELKSIPGNVPNPKYMPKGCKLSRDVHTLRKNAARKNRDFSRSKKAISADAGSAKADSSKQIT